MWNIILLDLITAGDIFVSYIGTHEQLADVITTVLIFVKLRTVLLFWLFFTKPEFTYIKIRNDLLRKEDGYDVQFLIWIEVLWALLI